MVLTFKTGRVRCIISPAAPGVQLVWFHEVVKYVGGAKQREILNVGILHAVTRGLIRANVVKWFLACLDACC